MTMINLFWIYEKYKKYTFLKCVYDISSLCGYHFLFDLFSLMVRMALKLVLIIIYKY